MSRAQLRIATVAAALALPIPACTKPNANLASPDPSERAAAIVAAADHGDAQAVHRLVELLEDRDLGVRMYANLALVRLCGADYGYHYYDPEELRAPAVERWRAALRDGNVTVLPAAARAAPSISANANPDPPPPDPENDAPRSAQP